MNRINIAKISRRPMAISMDSIHFVTLRSTVTVLILTILIGVGWSSFSISVYIYLTISMARTVLIPPLVLSQGK